VPSASSARAGQPRLFGEGRAERDRHKFVLVSSPSAKSNRGTTVSQNRFSWRSRDPVVEVAAVEHDGMPTCRSSSGNAGIVSR